MMSRSAQIYDPNAISVTLHTVVKLHLTSALSLKKDRTRADLIRCA